MAFSFNVDAAAFVPGQIADFASVTTPSVGKPQPSSNIPAFLGRFSTPQRKGIYQVPTVECKPAVVSVRKNAAKGCARVMLRDREILERSVEQRVAVVDGVCVEVRRDSKRVDDNAADGPVGGVFVAWGHRVERKVPVSEEGLEAYFNGLAGVARPSDLKAVPPFSEELQRFTLESSQTLKLNMQPAVDDAVPERLADSVFCSRELVQGLWDAKKALDDVWQRPPPPMGRGICQRIARDELFPHTGKEGDHENRAGDKLAELIEATGFLKDVPVGSRFLDLCGGPGAWSQLLLEQSHLKMQGFGFTLASGTGGTDDWHAEEKDDWYQDLYRRREWQALWGKDDSGDLLKPGNLEHCTKQINKAGGVFLCAADGGFSDKEIPANLLELYFYRLMLAELLTAATCLKVGGRFICKLYSSYSSATSSLLYVTTKLFDHSSIVKPKTSRVSGPERYLVCFGFKGTGATKDVVAALKKSHEFGGSTSLMQTPLLSPVVLEEEMRKDDLFTASMNTMLCTLCQRQTSALRAILSRADFLERVALEAASHATGKTAK